MFMSKEDTEVMDASHTLERTMAVKFRTGDQVGLVEMFTSVQALDCKTCMNLGGHISKEIPASLARAKRIMALMRRTFVLRFL